MRLSEMTKMSEKHAEQTFSEMLSEDGKMLEILRGYKI